MIVDYVQNFFQCRHCASNFKMKVRSIRQGILPISAKDTMLWLWQIHNMANTKLAGILHHEASEFKPHPWNLDMD